MQATTLNRPRYDSATLAGRPWVTYLLMLAIMLVVVAETIVASNVRAIEEMIQTYGLVSADFRWTDPGSYVPLVTYNFLHSSGRHFGGNAIIMLFACAAVERHAGRRATLCLWLLGGVVAGIAHLMIVPDADRALVGASGAISAMLGAAFVIGWKWSLPIRLRRGGRAILRIPLSVVTSIWVAFQVVSFAQSDPGAAAGSTVATWVHLAGFTFGVVAAGVLYLYQARTASAQHTFALSGD